ncbi:MAG: ATP-grasp domain-containing protein [Deltaproteobacteria bacterium]|nr:ATP-grasp domain-containing protein [Deltaproteobacteria bacterium]
MFRRILIANRGEIAARIIRSCHALGVESVAVYSDADSKLRYLNEATHAAHIGPSPATQSYLNQNILLEVALKHDCEAIHPGYGFLSENALFATRCEQQKLTFIGPKPWQIRMMGDKATAIATMQAAGLPILPGSPNILASPEQAAKVADILGYPVLLKATAGGGGKGIRLVKSHAELKQAYFEASSEAEKAFSNSGLYLEKYLPKARHIEFQILADAYGQIACLGERDCSIQQRHQKLLEEAPAPNFSPKKRAEISQKITQALQQIGYLGAGTLEFLMDTRENLYFMEMNTRIQVEHPVTEMVTGLDLIAEQIKIAAGEKLSQDILESKPGGAAIECRINALETGAISNLNLPKNTRFDTYLYQDTAITPYYDSMIGKLIVHASDRKKAVAAMQNALKDLKIDGIKTTQPLHQAILEDSNFKKGNYSTAFFEDFKWPK